MSRGGHDLGKKGRVHINKGTVKQHIAYNSYFKVEIWRRKIKKLRNTERGGGVDAEIEDALGFSYRVRRQIVWVVLHF